MKLLVVGHSLIIDSNRKFWSIFAKQNKVIVDLIVPKSWVSTINPRITFSYNSSTDLHLRSIRHVDTYLKGKGSYFIFSPWQTYKVLNSQMYDCIYLNQETWALSTLFFIFVKFFSYNRNTKLFLCVAQNLKKEKFKFLHPYERFISKFIHAFLYCSEGVRDVLRWKGIKNPCYYFPLPYDDENYKPTPLKKKSNQFSIGYMGRITEDKGIRTLLSSLDALNKSSDKYQLILAGNGELVEEAKTRPYVKYLGVIPHNQAYKFYQDIDCFILPSMTTPHWKEQFGRVIVESFGGGRPVIGSSSGSIPEILKKLEWPFIYKEGSYLELQETILELERFIATDEGENLLRQAMKRNHDLFSNSGVSILLFQTLQGASLHYDKTTHS